MIDTIREHLISFGEAAKRLPKRDDGRTVSTRTVSRWAMTGLKGIFLEYIAAGGRRLTSIEACHRFFQALTTELASHDRPDAESPGRHGSAKTNARVARQLTDLGYLDPAGGDMASAANASH